MAKIKEIKARQITKGRVWRKARDNNNNKGTPKLREIRARQMIKKRQGRMIEKGKFTVKFQPVIFWLHHSSASAGTSDSKLVTTL